MLVLAAICAAPAVSAAQDAGTTTATTTTSTTPTTTTPDPVVPPKDPVVPAKDPVTTTTAAAPPPVTVSSPKPKAHASASASVNTGDFFFSPGSVTIAVGDTVSWHNSGEAPHNATANNGSFATGTINPGGSGSHTFNSAGTFSYICTIHPQMKGTVRVLSSGGSGGSGGAGSSSSGTSEASAVTSPDAAGTSTTLPMTGMAVGALALVGLALLASGVLVRRAGGTGRRWLSIF
jgi:plastocyanin